MSIIQIIDLPQRNTDVSNICTFDLNEEEKRLITGGSSVIEDLAEGNKDGTNKSFQFTKLDNPAYDVGLVVGYISSLF